MKLRINLINLNPKLIWEDKENAMIFPQSPSSRISIGKEDIFYAILRLNLTKRAVLTGISSPRQAEKAALDILVPSESRLKKPDLEMVLSRCLQRLAKLAHNRHVKRKHLYLIRCKSMHSDYQLHQTASGKSFPSDMSVPRGRGVRGARRPETPSSQCQPKKSWALISNSRS